MVGWSVGVQTESGAWGKDQFPARQPQPLSQPTFCCITLYPKLSSSTIVRITHVCVYTDCNQLNVFEDGDREKTHKALKVQIEQPSNSS